ncbi:MAG: hypothetical protein AB8G99_10185 [Planctomycetaceae bacterium]
MKSLICLALVASSSAAVLPQSSAMKLPATQRVAHALVQVQNGNAAIAMNTMEAKTQEFEVPVTYTVEVNGRVEQRQKTESRTR